VIERRFLEEWPLAAFTLAIQVACGIAIATTMVILTQGPAQPAAARVLGISVFPIAAVGILLSLIHLGHPLSGWRALSNCLHSRLSLEILQTAAFGVSAFACSFMWWNGTTALRIYAGLTASLFGIGAVVAGAAIYQIPARRIWNSAWVLASFIGSTVIVIGLALSICSAPSRWCISAVIAGSTLLLLSGARMWARMPHPLEHAGLFRTWFTGYLLLTVATPLLLMPLRQSSGVFLTCTVLLGLIIGRMLMLALGELEQRF
jgi:DMSO reductase anchor subunit